MKLKQKKDFFIRAANTSATEEDKKKYITGCIPYHTRSCDLGGFTEIIEPSAFSKTLKDGNNVVLLYNHDDSKVLGSTRAGTLKLESRDDGLHFSCLVNEEVGFARDAYSIINRGDCNTISFGFSPIKTENRNGIRHLKEVALSEISCCVPFPAYKDGYAVTNFRSYMMDNNINYELIEDALSNSDNLSDAQKEAIKELITSLQDLVKEDEKPAEGKEDKSADEKPVEEKAEKPENEKADKKKEDPEKEETINTEEPEKKADEPEKEAAEGEQLDDTQNPEGTSDEEKSEEKEGEPDVDKEKLKEESEKLAELLNLIDEELAR